jgi:hypothetical protein
MVSIAYRRLFIKIISPDFHKLTDRN